MRDDMERLPKDFAKPCPFCGSQPFIQYWHGGSADKRMISCEMDSCYASPQITGPNYKTALCRWNMRKP